MDQRLSRPERWQTATALGIRAVSDLHDLQSRWRMKLRKLSDELANLRDEQRSRIKQLEDALTDLINLQSEYENWGVPENLEDSRLRDKLYDVQNFTFEKSLDHVAEMTKFPAEDEIEQAVESFDDPYDDVAWQRRDSRSASISILATA